MREFKAIDLDLLHGPVSLCVWVSPFKIDCFVESVTKDFFLPIYRRKKRKTL